MAGEDHQAVQRGAKFMGHVRQEFGLVGADLLQLPGLSQDLAAGLLHLAVFDVDLLALPLQQLGTFLQLLV